MKKPGGGAKVSAPSGTVTFLFSDIEGSTIRWDRNRAAMQEGVRRHDALMRTAIAHHEGCVFKTVGDAFCAAFARPEDAVAAVLEAQRALGAEDFSAVDGLRVRAAVHTGTADERDGDYFGPALNRVARLLAIGHGGQVLVSSACTELVQGDLPPQAALRDLGEHRLKDLARPEHVYQLVAPDLTADFPPLRSLQLFENNLPLQLSTFVGRAAEIADITALIEKHRLVTLVGSGGVGKSRLSLQVAANLLDGFEAGVWFVELAPLTSGDYIPSAIAQALGLTPASDGDPMENAVRALEGKQTLLVFDNCEHLIEPAARAISAILHGAPRVKVLASSRQATGVGGEATYQVPSLRLPRKAEPHTTAIELMSYESVALFVERARAANDTFSLSDDDAPAIAEICRRLDGIPLAIELAAARVKMLGPRQLRDRLDERFRVLTGGSRDVLPRQQTLRATIDWSHDLLDEPERTMFRRLAIFVNGSTLEGAIAIGSGDDLDELDVFDMLASLVDKSLVLAEPHGGVVRYRLLESTRAYASEKLDIAGERARVTNCHLRYLRDYFAELFTQRERTARTTELHAALQIELEDVRSALDTALVSNEALDGGELLANIYGSWRTVGLDAEGTARCKAYLAVLPADESLLRARLESVMSDLLSGSGHKVRAFELAAQAVEHAGAIGNDSLLARALRAYATAAAALSRFDDAEKALARAEAIGGISPFVRTLLLGTRAFVSSRRGDTEAAVRVYEQLRDLHHSLGDTNAEQSVALNLAEIEHKRGQTLRAIAIVREALPLVRSSANKGNLATLLLNLAGYLAAAGDLDGAIAASRESIRSRPGGEPDHAHVAGAIEHVALAFALRGDIARAAVLGAYADAAFERHGFEREFTETTTHDRLTALLQDGIRPDELARLATEGAGLTPEAAIALATQEEQAT